MIGQYLPNNNKKSYSTVLQKLFGTKPAPWAAVPVFSFDPPNPGSLLGADPKVITVSNSNY
jgi:hypothetical protein